VDVIEKPTSAGWTADSGAGTGWDFTPLS